jgi:hypothetical protein
MPFQKGQSGNPKGRKPRPVEDQAASVIARVFDQAAEERVIRAQIDLACDPTAKGSTAAARFLFDRKYGPPQVQAQDNELIIRVEYE